MNIIGNWDVIHCYNHHYWFSYRILCVLIVIYVMGIYIYIHIFIHIYYSHCLNSYKSILLTFLSAMNKLLKKTLISLHDYFYLYHSFNFRKLRDLKVRIHLPVIYYFQLKRRKIFFFNSPFSYDLFPVSLWRALWRQLCPWLSKRERFFFLSFWCIKCIWMRDNRCKWIFVYQSSFFVFLLIHEKQFKIFKNRFYF